MTAVFRAIGSGVLQALRYFGQLTQLGSEVGRSVLKARIRWGLLARQIVAIGFGSQVVVIITGSFIGGPSADAPADARADGDDDDDNANPPPNLYIAEGARVTLAKSHLQQRNDPPTHAAICVTDGTLELDAMSRPEAAVPLDDCDGP